MAGHLMVQGIKPSPLSFMGKPHRPIFSTTHRLWWVVKWRPEWQDLGARFMLETSADPASQQGATKRPPQRDGSPELWVHCLSVQGAFYLSQPPTSVVPQPCLCD